MPVTERLEDPGSFTIQLDANEVPFDEIRLMKELGQIIITPASFLHLEMFADSDLLAAARYSGVLLEVEWTDDVISLHGQGPWWYLGDANGNGPTLDADVTYAAATVDDILKSISSGGILPQAISAGTITTTGVGTYTGTFYASQTCLSAVRTVLTTLGMHARINPDWTIDACLATRDEVFTVTSPTVVAVKKGFGADPTYTGIEPNAIRNRIDAIRWVSKSIIENVDAAGARSVLSSSVRSVIPYQDGLGNQLDRAVIQSGPASDDVGFTTFHAQALDQWDTQKEEEITTDQFDFSGAFQVGDWIYVYAPELGFHDETNQIFYRGLALSPLALQVPFDSWPVVTPEMGVYYRPSRTNYAQAVLGDGPIAYWRLGEPSGGTATDEVGDGHDGTYVNTPTLGVTGIMADGSGDTAVDFDRASSEEVTDSANLGDYNVTSMSLEAWVKTSYAGSADASDDMMIVARDDHDLVGKPRQFQFGITYQGLIRFTLLTDGSSTSLATATGTTDIRDGDTHHVVVTYDASYARIYLDGQLEKSSLFGVSIDSSADAVLRIGSRRGTVFGDNYFDETIDEVAFYGRVLTGADIAEHYAIGRQGNTAGRWLDLTRYVQSERR